MFDVGCWMFFIFNNFSLSAFPASQSPFFLHVGQVILALCSRIRYFAIKTRFDDNSEM